MSRSDLMGGISATIETVRYLQLELCYDLVSWEEIIKGLVERVFMGLSLLLERK